jgi:hypothetical protein
MVIDHELHFFATKQVVNFATEWGVTYLRNAHHSAKRVLKPTESA